MLSNEPPLEKYLRLQLYNDVRTIFPLQSKHPYFLCAFKRSSSNYKKSNLRDNPHKLADQYTASLGVDKVFQDEPGRRRKITAGLGVMHLGGLGT